MVLYVTCDYSNEYKDSYNKNCQFVLKIVSNGDEREDGTFYICRAMSVDDKLVNYKTNIRVKISEDQNAYNYGDVFKVNLKIYEPERARNPGNFDYREYLMTIKVSATATIKDTKQMQMIENKPDNLFVGLGIKINKIVVRTVRELLPDRNSAMTELVLIGNKEYVDKEVEADFSNSGISHLIAVSGAHAIFFIMPFTYVLKKLNVKKQKRYLIEIVLLLCYLSITGFNISVVRAVVIIIIKKLAFILKRDSDRLVSILIALLILMIGNPYVVHSVGLQLSFGAALSLDFICPMIKRGIERFKWAKYLPGVVKKSFYTSIGVQIGILPIIINNFNMPSVFSLPANLIAAPITEIMLLSGMAMVAFKLLGITFVAQAIAYMNYFFGEVTIVVSRVFSQLSNIKIFNIVHMTLLSVFVYYIALLGLIYADKKKFNDSVDSRFGNVGIDK